VLVFSLGLFTKFLILAWTIVFKFALSLFIREFVDDFLGDKVGV
jgi:hypothetical protein